MDTENSHLKQVKIGINEMSTHQHWPTCDIGSLHLSCNQLVYMYVCMYVCMYVFMYR